MSRSAAVPIGDRCVLCGVALEDDLQIRAGLCDSCAKRPEAKRVGARSPAAPSKVAARAFTPADKALIRSMHGQLPAIDLLRLLNHRMVADLGPKVPLYTLEQLHGEVQTIPAAPASADDWSRLRRVLAEARTTGVLASITPQILDDFGAVFQLSPAQLMNLRNVIRGTKEGL